MNLTRGSIFLALVMQALESDEEREGTPRTVEPKSVELHCSITV